ncbi:hypothetical protein ACS0TY_002173 [Phlomoides rotata]
MGSNAARLALVLLLHATLLLLSVPAVRCDDEEDHLLQGINSFRQSSRAGPVAKHDKANCVADEIADKLENQNCAGAPPQSQLASDYPNVLKKCQVDPNATTDGMILPVCVSRRVPTLVLTNYTQSSQNARYLNDSRFTGAGIGKEDDCVKVCMHASYNHMQTHARTHAITCNHMHM